MGLFSRLFGGAESQASAYDPRGPVVIVVRDSGKALADALRTDARAVVVLSHRETAIEEHIANQRPSVIVMSIESDGKNGFLITKSIKTKSALRGIPVVLFSAEATRETFDQHAKLRTRADAYVTGTDPVDIKAAVDAL